MDNEPVKVYRARWLVLAVFGVMAALTQVLWLTFAPITGPAAAYYGKSDLMIGLLSMVFMIVYIVLAIPAAWAIDTWGFKAAAGLGAALSAVFALLRGLCASNYTIVLLSQIGIALGQPLVIGAITKVAVRWFPVRERATASGLGTLALYIGPLAAMLLSPYLFVRSGMKGMLLVYGAAMTVTAVLFLAVAREHPPTPAGNDERVLMFDGLKAMLRQAQFPAAAGHIFHRARPVQRSLDVGRGHRPAARVHHFPGRDAGRRDARGRHRRRDRHPAHIRQGPAQEAFHRPGPRRPSPRPFGNDVRDGGLAAVPFGLRLRVLPAERRPHRLSVRSRDHPPRPRRHIEQPAHPDGPGLGHRLHLRHGRPEGQGDGFDDGAASRSGRPRRLSPRAWPWFSASRPSTEIERRPRRAGKEGLISPATSARCSRTPCSA
ncbi:MAG: MFS transporter [Desulfobacterales bacterium]|nr:MFS transporter [Desulfobacterales bacterium]